MKTKSKVATLADVRRWMIEDLARSGLTSKDMRVTPHLEVDGPKLGLPTHPGPFYTIEYLGVDGKPTGFIRARYQQTVEEHGFLKGVKLPKYLQTEGSDVQVYIPLGMDMLKILSDPTIPVDVVEGEKKGSCLVKNGHFAVGLTGVSCYGQKKRGVLLLPLLQRLAKGGRVITIGNDRDVPPNPDVLRATVTLAKLLADYGADVRILELPLSSDGKKNAVDDYIVANGKDGKDAYDKLHAEAKTYALCEHYIELSAQYGYIHDQGMILEYPTTEHAAPLYHSPKAFVDHVESWRKIPVEKKPPISAARAWLDSPARPEYYSVVCRPGQGRVVDGCYNVWAGWGVEPSAASTEPFEKLAKHVIPNPEQRAYFLDWAAYPVQHPGVKMHVGAVLCTHRQGAGKSLLAQTLERVYGKANFSEVDEAALKDPFMEWLPNKQFVVGEEINGAHGREFIGRIKNLVTSPTIRVNRKYREATDVENHANFLFLTNDIDSFSLEPEDRRLFVIDSPANHLEEQQRAEYVAWLEKKNGAGALLGWLQRRDVSKFNPYANPPVTDGKLDMIESARSGVEGFVHLLKTEPDAAPIDEYSAFKKVLSLHTIEELLKMFGEKKGHTTRSLRIALLNEGFQRTGKDALRIGGDRKAHLWITRNTEKIAAMSPKQIEDHYAAERNTNNTRRFTRTSVNTELKLVGRGK